MPRKLDDSDFDAVVDELFGPGDSEGESFGRMRGGGGGRHGPRGGRFHRRGPRRWRYHRWHQRGPWAYPYWGWGYPGYVYPYYDSIPPLDPDQIGDIVADIPEDDEDDEDDEFGELEFGDEDEDTFGYGEASIEAKLGPYLARRNTAGLRGYPLEWRWP